VSFVLFGDYLFLSNIMDNETNEIANKERRSLLAAGVRISVIVFLPISAARAAMCVDPDELGSADRSFRKYVEYTESSTKSSETCSNCASFKPGQPEPSDCGSCQVVAGAINPKGHCTGWSARAK
jgi:hypothetical protein